MPENRLSILQFPPTGGQNTFADDVRRGLTSHPKYLDPKYFYDSLGSHLFEAICHLPEYYVTRAEGEILQTERQVLAKTLRHTHRLIELGSGSSTKTRMLIEIVLEQQEALEYFPIDISESALKRSANELVQIFSGLTVTGVAAEYYTALDQLTTPRFRSGQYERTVVLFLGSSIGNLDHEGARDLLQRVRATLRKGDALLLGTDLRKSESLLILAYDDPLGVTAAFNLNLLVRINRELGGEFDVAQFDHRAIYNREHHRVEMHLVSRKSQNLLIRDLDLRIHFDRGEWIHTENSYKFSTEALRSLARDSGFEMKHQWFDSQKLFSLSMLETIEE